MYTNIIRSKKEFEAYVYKSLDIDISIKSKLITPSMFDFRVMKLLDECNNNSFHIFPTKMFMEFNDTKTKNSFMIENYVSRPILKSNYLIFPIFFMDHWSLILVQNTV